MNSRSTSEEELDETIRVQDIITNLTEKSLDSTVKELKNSRYSKDEHLHNLINFIMIVSDIIPVKVALIGELCRKLDDINPMFHVKLLKRVKHDVIWNPLKYGMVSQRIDLFYELYNIKYLYKDDFLMPIIEMIISEYSESAYLFVQFALIFKKSLNNCLLFQQLEKYCLIVLVAIIKTFTSCLQYIAVKHFSLESHMTRSVI